MYVSSFLSAIGLATTVMGWSGAVPAPVWVSGVVLTALAAPLLAYRKMHQRLVALRSELRLLREERIAAKRERDDAIIGERDRARERFDAMEARHKEAIGTLETQNRQLRAEVENLRDNRDFRNALAVALRGQFYNEGDCAQFRLEVTNTHPFRTIDHVRVRVLSIECIDGSDKKPRVLQAIPLLAMTGSGSPPSNPFKTEDMIAGGGAVLFDFVLVHSGRRANHSLNFGECRVWHPNPQHLHAPKWERIYDGVLGAGMYRVEIEIQGKDVSPVRKAFVFWGDKRGPKCVAADDPAVQSAHPLEFAPTDLETLPAEMHPHQLEALERVLRQPEYDKMLPTAVFWRINDDPHHLGGLAGLSFTIAEKMRNIKEDRRDRWVVVSDEYASQFPGRTVPGFPNAIRRADFDIAWKKARG